MKLSTSGAVGRRASAEEIRGEVAELDQRLEQLEETMTTKDGERDRLRTLLAAARAEAACKAAKHDALAPG